MDDFLMDDSSKEESSFKGIKHNVDVEDIELEDDFLFDGVESPKKKEENNKEEKEIKEKSKVEKIEEMEIEDELEEYIEETEKIEQETSKGTKELNRIKDVMGLDFNKEQEEIITHSNKPLVVLSGAGSGKTTVLVSKMLYREIKDNIKPINMLAITFSKRATDEMQDRYFQARRKMNLKKVALPTFKTFHSLFKMLLSVIDGYKHVKVVSYTNYLYELSKYVKMVDEKQKSVVLESMFNYQSYLINHGLSLDGIENAGVKLKEEHNFNLENYKTIVSKYLELKEEDGAIDFNDMQAILYKEIVENKNKKPIDAFRRVWGDGDVYVDEYQDVCNIQIKIMDALIKDFNRFTVIGDDDQCWHEDSLVKTTEGTVKMKDIKVGDKVETMQKGKVKYLEVTHKTDVMEKETVTIKTELGKEITVTYDHKCFVYNGSIETQGKERFILHMNQKKHGVLVYDFEKGNIFPYNRYKDAYKYVTSTGESYKEIYDYMGLYISVMPAEQIKEGHHVPIVINGEQRLDKVISVSPLSEKKKVYHLEVAETGILVADGVITHNSIYSFRGSNPQFIRDFPFIYENSERKYLSINYRCKENILNPILSSINKNENRVPKNIKAFNSGGEVEIIDTSENDEMYINAVIDELGDDIEEAILDDIAILVRHNSQRMLLSDKLIETGVPINIVNRQFSLQKNKVYNKILDVIYMIKEQDFKLFSQLSRTIFPHIHKKVIQKYQYSHENWYNDLVLENHYAVPNETINSIREIEKTNNMYNLVGYAWKLLRDDYRRMAKAGFGNMETTQEIVKHMLNISKGLTKTEFLELEKKKEMRIDLWEGSDEALRIDTIHSVKGLEFGTVFIYGVDDTVIPNEKYIEGLLRKGSKKDVEEYIEEERRLFYVAWTRAKDRLVVGYNKNRPSRFMSEVTLEG